MKDRVPRPYPPTARFQPVGSQPTRALMGKLRHRKWVILRHLSTPSPQLCLEPITPHPRPPPSPASTLPWCTAPSPSTHRSKQRHCPTQSCPASKDPFLPKPLSFPALQAGSWPTWHSPVNLLLSLANYSKYFRRAHRLLGQQAGALLSSETGLFSSQSSLRRLPSLPLKTTPLPQQWLPPSPHHPPAFLPTLPSTGGTRGLQALHWSPGSASSPRQRGYSLD